MPKLGLTELAPKLQWPKYFYQGFNRQYFHKVLAERPIAYWPLWEASGSVAFDISGNGLHGTYDGVTLGAAGPDGKRTCPLFDGDDDYVDIYSAGLNTAWKQGTSTILLWAKVFEVGNWSDEWRTIFQLRADAQNYLKLYSPANEEIYGLVEANNTTEYVVHGTTSTDFMCLALTNEEATDEFKLHLDGVAVVEEALSTGVFAGNLDSSLCLLGDKDQSGGDPWHGYIADVAIFDSVKTSTQIASLALR